MEGGVDALGECGVNAGDPGDFLDAGRLQAAQTAVGPNGGNVIFDLTPGVGTYPNNALIKDTLHLPEGGCYSLHFVDAYGDGMCCGFGNGYYKLYNIDNPVIPIMTGDAFGAYDDRGFGALSASVGVQENSESFDLEMYPNPASDQLFLEWNMPDETAHGTVYNALGQAVFHFQAEKTGSGRQYAVLSLANWSAGTYWMYLQMGEGRVLRQFSVNR